MELSLGTWCSRRIARGQIDRIEWPAYTCRVVRPLTSKGRSGAPPQDEAGAGSAVAQACDALFTFVRSAPAGTGLPPERELAARLGVSRTTLRIAVDRLALLGYLRVRHGSGSVVARPTAADLATPFATAVLDVPRAVEDVSALRLLVEPELAASAARSARSGTATRWDAALDASDQEFHQQVARASGNEVAAQVVGVLVGLAHTVPGATGSGDRRLARVTAQHHLALISAIEDGDEELARESMALHLRWEARRLTATRE